MSDCTDENGQFSWFSEVIELSEKQIYSTKKQFRNDECSYKLDFGFPGYRDEQGRPWVDSVIRTAERVLAHDDSLDKEFIYPFGYESFNNSTVKLLLGENSAARVENRTFTIQTVSSTGGIRVGAEFLAHSLGLTKVYTTQPVIDSMDGIFLSAGFKKHEELRYINYNPLSFDMDGMLHDLSHAKPRSVIFLQVCGHNPTGYDPSLDDWEKIAEIITSRKLFPFLFCRYQGFVSGDIEKDVSAVRMFEKKGIEFFCAQSYAWNFGLYNERVGCLSIIVNDSGRIHPIKSHLLNITRHMYSSPPNHGARVIAFILGDKMLTEPWKDSLAAIADRLKRMRSYLREELERLGAPGRWSHITDQVGMFCLTGLTEMQVEYLKNQYHIYLLANGRLNISGLNPDNVEYVAKAIFEVLETIPPIYSYTVSTIC